MAKRKRLKTPKAGKPPATVKVGATSTAAASPKDKAGAAASPKDKAVATDAVPAVSVPTAASPVIRCNGYQLAIFNTPDLFRLDLDLLTQPDSVQYHLRITGINDRTELVQKLLNKLAVLWPAFDFHFTADDRGEITNLV